jgi:predicted ArsR family transcriptional regulator
VFYTGDIEPTDHIEQRIGAIAALDQPLRRELYRLLGARGGWVSRDDASEALGVARSVAAFHLDKLVESGVVEVTFERTSGRTGPGAGRPAKLYRRATDELSASVPARRYDLAGSLFATAIAESERTGSPIAESLSATARAAGRVIGEEVAAATGPLSKRDERRQAVLEILGRHGYEPTVGKRGEIALVNCPFHRLAEEHRTLVCGMNLDFLGGLVEGIGTGKLDVRLAPEPGYCCVRISAS